MSFEGGRVPHTFSFHRDTPALRYILHFQVDWFIMHSSCSELLLRLLPAIRAWLSALILHNLRSQVIWLHA